MKFPLNIKNSTIHTEFWTLASFHQGIENSRSWLQFARNGTSNTWQAGMSSDNSYVIRASDATDRLIVNQNGNTRASVNVSVNLDVSVSNARASVNAYNAMEGYTRYIELEAKWNSQGYLKFEPHKPGAHYLFSTVKDDFHMYCGSNLVHMYKDTIDGNLDVGVGAAPSIVKARVNHEGSTGHIRMEAQYRNVFLLSFDTTYSHGYIFLEVNDYYMYCGNNLVHMYNDTTVDGNLDVGQSQAQTSIKAWFNHVGSTGFMMTEGRYRDQGLLHFGTNYQYGELFLTVRII